MRFSVLYTALFLTLSPSVALPEVRQLTFLSQAPTEPRLYDAPATAASCPTVMAVDRYVFVEEPTGGVTPSTGLLLVLYGINAASDCQPAYGTPDPQWADAKDLVIAQVGYRNLGFLMPHDLGKLQVVDVMRGLGRVLEEYPQLDRQRICLFGSSGGGQLGLQVLQATPFLWSEVHLHSSITRMTIPTDVATGLYDRDPRSGWNGNLGFPIIQGELDEAKWMRYQAERTLRGPQHHARFHPPAGDPRRLAFPVVWMMHGTADELVDYQHLLDYKAALAEGSGTEPVEIAPKVQQLQNWFFVEITNGTHGYGGAAGDENTRVKASNKYVPQAFMARRETMPELSLTYTYPSAFGWTWKLTAPTFSEAELVALPVGEGAHAWSLH